MSHNPSIIARDLIDHAIGYFAGVHGYRVDSGMDGSFRASMARSIIECISGGRRPAILVSHSWDTGEPGRVWFDLVYDWRDVESAAVGQIKAEGAWKALHIIDVLPSLESNRLQYVDARWTHIVSWDSFNGHICDVPICENLPPVESEAAIEAEMEFRIAGVLS